ncbi:MAG: type III-B CRISPR-associated protein Cas10/Cmr2 [Odoribacter splanchnicus]
METVEKKYIALTFGPITRAVGFAESTKELWAASYFFSYLAKTVIAPFSDRTFLLPLVDKQMFEISEGAGLFPDRYIFEAQKEDFEKLDEHISTVLYSISENMNLSLKIEDGVEKINVFLKAYLKIFFVEKSFNASLGRRQIVADCEHTLNLLEMQETFPDKEKINYLYAFFRQVNGNPIWEKDKIISGFNGTFLTLDAYGKKSKGEKLFESIIEISASELEIDLIDRYNRAPEDRKKEVKDKYLIDAENLILEDKQIRPYHKYIAIVKSDGDSMGKTIEEIDDTSKLSRALLAFNNDTVRIIKEYGGKPVFIGGDDLLFFAPVCYKGKTIFDLIQSLDNSFAASLAEHIGSGISLPTLSYGISISYYKYPMFEALNAADYLLERLAKGRELQEKLVEKGIKEVVVEKNNVAFAMQKHSGQMYTALFHKRCSESYKLLLEIVRKYCRKSSELEEQNQDEEKFLVSVIHKFREQSFMLSFILKNDSAESLLKNFFENTFNEKVHKSYTGLFDDVQKFMIAAYKEFKTNFIQFNQKVKDEKLNIDFVTRTLEQIATVLQFIHFVNSRNDE